MANKSFEHLVSLSSFVSVPFLSSSLLVLAALPCEPCPVEPLLCDCVVHTLAMQLRHILLDDADQGLSDTVFFLLRYTDNKSRTDFQELNDISLVVTDACLHACTALRLLWRT